MKKYLLVLVWFVFFVYPNAGLGTGFSTTHALSLKGVVTDAVNSEKIDEVEITLSTNPAKSATTDGRGKFTIEDFIPPEKTGWIDGIAIDFKKEGYIDRSGVIYTEHLGEKRIGVGGNKWVLGNVYKLYYREGNEEGILLGTYAKYFETSIENEVTNEGETNPVVNTTTFIKRVDYINLPGVASAWIVNPDNQTMPNQIEIKMPPAPEKIISGTVYYETDDGDTVPLEDVQISVEPSENTTIVYDENCSKDWTNFSNTSYIISGNCSSTDNDGEFEVWGYFKKDKNGDYEKVNYTITATDNEDRFFAKSVTKYVEDAPEDGVQIILKEKTISQAREDNLTGITGFKCNELMPKYLAGANCNDNKTLEGDATDLAYWIQKIGGKIAGAIAMIAVVLIVWNAFNMVTAAGDEDKISTAKKGLMWAIIGLALTMFAYVIVKTVIMLAYTQ